MRYSKESDVVFRLGACLCDLIYALVYDTCVGEESGVMYMCNGRTGQEDASSQNHRRFPQLRQTVVGRTRRRRILSVTYKSELLLVSCWWKPYYLRYSGVTKPRLGFGTASEPAMTDISLDDMT